MIRNVAEYAPVPGLEAVHVGPILSEADDADAVPRQIPQGLGEKRPSRQVGRRERIADEGDLVGGRQALERERPHKAEDGLRNQPGLREYRRNDDRLGFEVSGDEGLRVDAIDSFNCGGA